MRFFVNVVVLMFVAVMFASAQPGRMGDRRPFERIEHLKKVRLIEMLDMNEEQSVRFFARLNEHETLKRDLMREKSEILDKIERLVRNRADDNEYEKFFPDILRINSRIADADQKFFEGLSDLLSAEQRGKYLLFERQFERELREALRDVQRRRNRMGE
ncbi:MAG: hypothetical protein HY708_00315 [Ignavibacteriae bacterium]|nr:hypothetical protein [Ignavibacteriota bacterium]